MRPHGYGGGSGGSNLVRRFGGLINLGRLRNRAGDWSLISRRLKNREIWVKQMAFPSAQSARCLV